MTENILHDLCKRIYDNSHKDSIDFYNFPVNKFLNLLELMPPEEIESRGQRMAFSLFQKASKDVPAYSDFLKSNGIKLGDIKTFRDFNKLPIITKKNYLEKYKYNELNWDGVFDTLHMVSVSSGSTGKPYLWPRGLSLERETSLEYEIILKKIFKADKKRTLFVIGYAMGMYVAGVSTLNSMVHLVKKGFPLTIVSPGSDKDSIISIIKELGDNFDQTIIAAYPPVLKDIVDQGVQEKIGWKKYNIKFISGGEGFSEDFRNYLYTKVGVRDYISSSVNTYGSADAAILGHETPVSILIRRIASKNQDLRKALFKNDKLPSLLQYYPFFKHFEEIDGNLIFTTHGGVPLIRYSVGDTGGIISFKKMQEVLNEFGIDLKSELNKNGYGESMVRLPFVYLFGRKDNTKIFYGANIYPEHIKSCLEHKDLITEVSEKYYNDIFFDKEHNQIFYLGVELAPGIKKTEQLKQKISDIIHNELLILNDEYKYLSKTIGSRIYPKLELFPYGDKKYFSTRIKPRYVKKN